MEPNLGHWILIKKMKIKMDVSDLTKLKNFKNQKVKVNYKTQDRTLWQNTDDGKFYILHLENVCMGIKNDNNVCAALIDCKRGNGFCSTHQKQFSEKLQ